MTDQLPIGARVKVARHWYFAGSFGTVAKPNAESTWRPGEGWTCVDIDEQEQTWIQTDYLEPMLTEVTADA